jgi:DNA-binding transcriptional LysR family regulator
MLYLTLRHYEYVAAVARHGSLSAAAQALNVSQPALSNALTRIEAQLDQPLFLRRRGAPLALTPQGRDFAARAQVLLEMAGQLEAKDQFTPVEQQLCLGCFVDLAPFWLAPALQILREALPGVRVSFRVEPFEPLISALNKGDIDLAVTYDLGLDASFERRELTRMRPFALMAPGHPLAIAPQVSLRQLAEHPLILSDEGLSVQHMLSLFKSAGLAPKVRHRAATLELMRSLAAHNEGVGVSYSLPPASFAYDGNPLAARPVLDPQAAEPLILASHGSTGSSSPAARAQEALLSRLPV